MDHQTSLMVLLDQLKTIITNQNIPHNHQPTTSFGNENINTEKIIPILPNIIPHLPKHLQALPSSPSQSTSLLSSLQPITDILSTHILPYLTTSSLSPNYYGFVTGGSTPAATLADWLVTIYDQNLSVHLPAETITTEIEIVALNLLVQLFNLPEDEWSCGRKSGNGGATFTTGATASNVLGLALGREHVVRKALERRLGATDDDKGTVIGDIGMLSACIRAGITDIKILSTLPHSSISKAASVVGIGRSNIISIASSSDPLDIDVEKFETLVREGSEDRDGKGRTVFILTVSAGEVNTGFFATNGLEIMTRLRAICDRYDVWMHVDGAFGLFGRVLMSTSTTGSSTTKSSSVTTSSLPSDSQHAKAEGPSDSKVHATPAEEDYTSIINGTSGIELADSITGDNHKLLNVPYDSGIFFTRHKQIMQDVCSNGYAAYLNPTTTATTTATSPSQPTTPNQATLSVSSTETKPQPQIKDTNTDDDDLEIQSPLNIGIENSRRFRALPVYTTLMTYGRQGYVEMLQRQIGLARKTAAWIYDSDGYTLLPSSSSSSSSNSASTTSTSSTIQHKPLSKTSQSTTPVSPTHQTTNQPPSEEERDSRRDEILRKTFIIVLFRATSPSLNSNLVTKINNTGKMYVSGTMWEGQKAARIAVSNWQVDVDRDFGVVIGVLRGILEGSA